MAEMQNVQSVERTFNIINVMSNYKEVSIKVLSEKTKLAKATVFRLLNTLVSLGYVYKNSKTEMYGLSPKFLKISSKILENFDIRNTVKPYLEKLSATCGETVHLVEQNGNNVVYIDKYEGAKSSFRMVSRIGMSLPMPFTAVGNAIMAELNDKQIKSIWDECEIKKRTPNTITDFDAFLTKINTARKNGYGVDNEENEIGVFCIAAALPNFGDNNVYAFSISAPVQRLNSDIIKQNINFLLETRNEILNSLF